MGTSIFIVSNQANSSTVNHMGGAIALGGTQMLVGNIAAGSIGTYNLSGGTLTGAASALRGIILGTNANTTGIFNLSGTFFFSSRRRHTRCSRDWSSDVCSSDLPGSAVGVTRQLVLRLRGDVLLQRGFRDPELPARDALHLLLRARVGSRLPDERLDDQIGRASCRERV